VVFEAHLQTTLGALQYKVKDFQIPARGGNTVSNKACGFLDEGKNNEYELMEGQQ
jgi:thiamine pyrophosphokinase